MNIDVSPDITQAEQGAAALMDELRRDCVTMTGAEAVNASQVNQLIGMARFAQFSNSVNYMAMLKTLKELKDRKAYKGIVMTDADGRSVQVKTWDSLCSTLGISRRKVEEDLQNLALFGEDMLKAQAALGLGYRDLRGLRGTLGQLPEGEKAEVKELISAAVASGDREEILATLEELGGRNKKLSDEVKAAKEDAEAARQRAADARDKMLAAEDELRALTSPQTEDSVDGLRNRWRTHALSNLDTACNEALSDVQRVVNNILHNMQPIDKLNGAVYDAATLVRINQRVSVMCQAMRDLLDGAGIEVDFAAEFGLDVLGLETPDEVGE